MVNLRKISLLNYEAEAAGVAAAKLKARFDKEVSLTASAK
jgi:hypothetical protein